MCSLTARAGELESVQCLSLGRVWGEPSPPPTRLGLEEGEQAAGACTGAWGLGETRLGAGISLNCPL